VEFKPDRNTNENNRIIGMQFSDPGMLQSELPPLFHERLS